MVSIGDRIADLEKNLETFFQSIARSGRTKRIAKPDVEAYSLDELHREIGNAVFGHRELVHGHDVRVLELAGHLRLGDEPLPVHRHRGKASIDSLQGDVA